MLDLAVTQTKNNLKSWFNVYLDKCCHKSIQKLETEFRPYIFVLFGGYFVFYRHIYVARNSWNNSSTNT